MAPNLPIKHTHLQSDHLGKLRGSLITPSLVVIAGGSQMKEQPFVWWRNHEWIWAMVLLHCPTGKGCFFQFSYKWFRIFLKVLIWTKWIPDGNEKKYYLMAQSQAAPQCWVTLGRITISSFCTQSAFWYGSFQSRMRWLGAAESSNYPSWNLCTGPSDLKSNWRTFGKSRWHAENEKKTASSKWKWK